jgi:hypothetical protein
MALMREQELSLPKKPLSKDAAAVMSHARRQFLKAGSIAVAAAAAQGCSVSAEAAPASSQVASFGWEVSNLCDNGANMYVEVLGNIILNSVNIDVSAMILATDKPGFAEVLCTGGVSRQAVPTCNNSGAHAYSNFPVSPSFGSVIPQNPNNLAMNFNQSLHQDQFFSVILKSWVPTSGTASSASRQFLSYPALPLNVGDYLVFHMDHAGIGVDAEMQIVLAYAPAAT